MRSKAALLESTKQHKLMIKNELAVISNKTTNIARNVFIIGCIATGAYLLYKAFSIEEDEKEIEVNKKKEVKRGNSFSGLGRIGKVLSHQALLFFLNESKNKIQEYLNDIEKDGADS